MSDVKTRMVLVEINCGKKTCGPCPFLDAGCCGLFYNKGMGLPRKVDRTRDGKDYRRLRVCRMSESAGTW